MSLSLDVEVRLVVSVLLSNWPTDKPVVAVATLLLLVTIEVDIVTVEVVPVVVRFGKLCAPMRGEAAKHKGNYAISLKKVEPILFKTNNLKMLHF